MVEKAKALTVAVPWFEILFILTVGTEEYYCVREKYSLVRSISPAVTLRYRRGTTVGAETSVCSFTSTRGFCTMNLCLICTSFIILIFALCGVHHVPQQY